jgi:hypothetical protein
MKSRFLTSRMYPLSTSALCESVPGTGNYAKVGCVGDRNWQAGAQARSTNECDCQASPVHEQAPVDCHVTMPFHKSHHVPTESPKKNAKNVASTV